MPFSMPGFSLLPALLLLSSCSTAERTPLTDRGPASSARLSSEALPHLAKIPRVRVTLSRELSAQRELTEARRRLHEAINQGPWIKAGAEETLLGPSASLRPSALQDEYIAAIRVGSDELETAAGRVTAVRGQLLTIQDPANEVEQTIELALLQEIHVLELHPAYKNFGAPELDSLPLRSRKAFDENEEAPALLSAKRDFEAALDRTHWESLGNEDPVSGTQVSDPSRLKGQIVAGVFQERHREGFRITHVFGGEVKAVVPRGRGHRLTVDSPLGRLLVDIPGTWKLHRLKPESLPRTGFKIGIYGAPSPELLEGLRKAVRLSTASPLWHSVSAADRAAWAQREVFGIATNVDGKSLAKVFQGTVIEARSTSSPDFFEVTLREADGDHRYIFGESVIFELVVRLTP